MLPPEQGSPRGPTWQSWFPGHTCWRMRDGVSTCRWGSRPATAPPHVPCSLKPRTTEPGKTGQGLREQWGEGSGLKPRVARAPGPGRLTPGCAVSGGWAEEGQKARRVEKCKGKSVLSGLVGEMCNLLHRGQGEGKGLERGRGPALRAAAGRVSLGWPPGRVRVEGPLQTLTGSPIDPAPTLKPHSHPVHPGAAEGREAFW